MIPLPDKETLNALRKAAADKATAIGESAIADARSMTKVNEQRQQMYLNGEVGVRIAQVDPSELIEQLDGAISCLGLHTRAVTDTFHPLPWFFEEDEPQTNRTPTHVTNGYQKLFDYLQDEHGVTLLVTDMDEIIRIVHGMQPTKPEPSRLDIAERILHSLITTNRELSTWTSADTVRYAYALTDEFLKQSKQTP